MPGKNIIKEFWAGGYYHLYNRGVAKQNIFCDDKDYHVFLRYLKEYLLPLDNPGRVELQGINPRRKAKTVYGEVELLAFCLMPNHFHLQVHNLTESGVTRFMRMISTNYSMHFNKRYIRVGPLFQGIYRAVELTSEGQYLQINRYIHRNPLSIVGKTSLLEDYPYSSYPAYLGKWQLEWLKSHEITDRFISHNPNLSYRQFVEQYEDIPHSYEPLFLGIDD